MLERIVLDSLDDIFVDIDKRKSKGVYFYRIVSYNPDIEDFILRYYEEARAVGIVIESRLSNPDEKNLSYFAEKLGTHFEMNVGFFIEQISVWLPRLDLNKRKDLACAMYDCMDELRKLGKNDNMLRNAYIKLMCWLYYKFEFMLSRLSRLASAKILYEGQISQYELLLMDILSKLGCDIVILDYENSSYYSLDKKEQISYKWMPARYDKFPEGFSIASIRHKLEDKAKQEKLFANNSEYIVATNTWISGEAFDDISKKVSDRGEQDKYIYNAYIRINGVDDRSHFAQELYKFQLGLKAAGRPVLIFDKPIEVPDMMEIAKINRRNYTSVDELILDLSHNLKYISNRNLQELVNNGFVQVMLEESKKPDTNLNKLAGKAIYIICWLRRYFDDLFSAWNKDKIAVIIYMPEDNLKKEQLFIKFLSRLPVDVLMLKPDLSIKLSFEDSNLYEINYKESLKLTSFPSEDTVLSMSTVASEAERELGDILYTDSGLYRQNQYDRAVALNLMTTFEEINIYWNQELKYRPNFAAVSGIVTMPVIAAKLSGVKDGNITEYWKYVRKMITDESIVIKRPVYIEDTKNNILLAEAPKFYKNSKLNRNLIKEHKDYKYAILRDAIQEHILDKIELIISQKMIKGIGQNGAEYNVIATSLDMPKEIIRLLQAFDFTRKNPKLIYINTIETHISLKDSILIALLSLLGFDILFLVPTGYQTIEKHFAKVFWKEHQIGEYMYDARVPELSKQATNKGSAWYKKMFGIGV